MPFTAEQDAFILKAHYRSGVRQEDGSWVYCVKSCIDQYFEKYPDHLITYKVFVQHRDRIVKRFESKNCICKGKSSGRPPILTEEVLDVIKQKIEASPDKSIRKIARQTGLSYSSARKVLHMFSQSKQTEKQKEQEQNLDKRQDREGQEKDTGN